MDILTPQEWDRFLQDFPHAHILQTGAWGNLKSTFGWEAVHVSNSYAGAQILFRKLPLGYHIAYLPKGPVGSQWQSLWSGIDMLCRKKRTIFLKVEPDAWENDLDTLSDQFTGFRHSFQTIQPHQTIIISLEGDEKSWLERMKQKTRYNIRLAERKGIVVKPSTEIDLFHKMAVITGKRDGFNVHSVAYYQKMFDLFDSTESCVLLMAYYQARPIAGIIVFRQGKRSWYLHGASTNEERNRMPTYLLQWEAMRWAASHQCTEYDLWGIPEVDESQLEEDFTHHSDGLWGVYRFKRGFGGTVMRSAGSWDRIYIPALYKLYQIRTKARSLAG